MDQHLADSVEARAAVRAMNTDTEITRLRQARDETQRALSDARRNLSAAQAAYAKARKAERAALLRYVEAMEAARHEGARA